MHTKPVEIYSDASNAAVLRHPDRRFPGVLVQGDTLYSLVRSLQCVVSEAASLSEDASGELGDVTEQLQSLLSHYKKVLMEHNIDLPFHEVGHE